MNEKAGNRPFAVNGLDHVVLRVHDMAAMLRFYGDVLGCAREREVPELGLYQLRAGRSLIDLVDVAGRLGLGLGAGPGREPAEGGRNMDHFCLRIDPFDEAALRRWLAGQGVAAGDSGRRYGAEGEGPSIYLTDPEGNGVELKGLPAP